MPRKKSNSQGNSSNENWIREENLSSWKLKARQLAHEREVYESKHKFTTIRIDKRTVKLVEIN